MTAIRPLAEPLRRPIRLVVLISGGGTTLVNLWDTIRRGELSAEIPLVIASRADCGGIEKARLHGVPCEVFTRKSFPSTEAFSAPIFQRCREVRTDLVICGGFLSLLKIPHDFRYRVMNIHPALIPAFCGHGFHGHAVHEAVLQRGCKVSGCTVHFLDDEYDHGPIIVQRTVPVLDGDTPDTLAARVFQEECAAYPEAIRLFASGRMEINGSNVGHVS
jgi:formyltetrahydrofolate-dependent phosphoribosylglycinamide formyltransferase